MRFGQRVDKQGYIGIKRPTHPRAWKNGYVYEHIIVAEEKLGRLLFSNEVVHHLNEDTTDNRPENLEVIDRVEHTRLHKATGRNIVYLVCPVCNKKFARERRQTHLAKGYKHPTCCSRSCRGILCYTPH